MRNVSKDNEFPRVYSVSSSNGFCFVRFGGEQLEENRVHLGNAIMSFYSALIDLLGRCAPEMHVSTWRL